jgi:hypothetical protein
MSYPGLLEHTFMGRRRSQLPPRFSWPKLPPKLGFSNIFPSLEFTYPKAFINIAMVSWVR